VLHDFNLSIIYYKKVEAGERLILTRLRSASVAAVK
jgi:hypothetical protein